MARHLKLEHLGPALTPDSIEAFEREIGGRLPDDYKEFLLAHNGGITELLLEVKFKGNTWIQLLRLSLG